MLLNHSLVLASESPRRDQILRMLGFDFTLSPSGVDETAPPGLVPDQVPEALARTKALHVSKRRDTELILGADTLVMLDDRILGKPAGPEEAMEMLHFLNGRTHRVYTGVALAFGGKIVRSGTACSEVTFARRKNPDLEAYVQSGEPMDKAGAYAIQGQGAFLVEGIRGCFFNVMGLPVQLTLQLLEPYRA